MHRSLSLVRLQHDRGTQVSQITARKLVFRLGVIQVEWHAKGECSTRVMNVGGPDSVELYLRFPISRRDGIKQ